MAKHGYGVTILDGETTILNYAVLYNNMDLLRAILTSYLNVHGMAVPTNGLLVPGTKQMIANTPLLQTVDDCKIVTLTKLVKHGIGTNVLDNANHVISYILNFDSDYQLGLIQTIARYIAFNNTMDVLGADNDGDPITQSSAVAQTLITTLMQKHANSC